MDQRLKDFILMLADNSMILGQRLGEWCGHGPILEQDIALTNMALDLIGEARNYYQYLAESEGKNEDDYPMLRDVRAFRNVLLVEQPNGHWADTMMRQCMFDCYHYFILQSLSTECSDQRLTAIARKSIKEATYHLAFSSDWVIRLGDGTEESHLKIQKSLHDLMPFFDELFTPESFETYCIAEGICIELSQIRANATSKLEQVVNQATLSMPTQYFSKKGGKSGFHTEHLGFILADMQFMQRAYPGLTW